MFYEESDHMTGNGSPYIAQRKPSDTALLFDNPLFTVLVQLRF